MAQAADEAAAAAALARAETVGALAPEGVKRLEALEELQKAADAHTAAMLEERKALELKYHALYAEAWKSRADILAGTTDPASSSASVGIPKFWLQAMQNHPAVADFIEERDEPALTSLQNITWDYLPDMKGFKLQLFFAPNDFFEDAVLTKEFHVPNLLEGKAIELEKSIGCDVHWKPGKDLTHDAVKKKVGKGKNKKVVTKVEPCPSFFRFFESIELDEAKARDMEHDEVMAIYQQMQAEADVGFALKNKIVPNAVHWFTGEAKDDDDDEDDDEYDGEDDDEEDDDGGDDEEEEEPEEKPAKKGGKGKGGKKKAAEEEEEEDGEVDANALKAAFEKPSGGGGPDDKPPECKQQ